MYFEDSFPPDFEIEPKSELKNSPIKIRPTYKYKKENYDQFIKDVAKKIANILKLD